MSRRTETAYKAESPGKSAQHDKAQDSGDTVNAAHHAVYQAREYIRKGYRIAVDMDLSKFFDTVNHDVLMHRVARKVRDKRVLRLIGKYLRAGVMVQGRLQDTRLGVPQGGPLSSLLANIIPSPNTSAAG